MVTEELVKKPRNKENEDTIRKYRDTGDEWLREDFFRRNLGLCRHIANKFSNTGLPFEELFSEAQFGMLKAFNTFDLDKDIKFATYASTCMNNEILMYMRKQTRHSIVTSLEEPIGRDLQGNELLLLDITKDESSKDIDRLHARYEATEALELAEKVLTKQELIVFQNMVSEERVTQKELAVSNELSQSYISRLEKRAAKKLRRALRKGELVRKTKKELGKVEQKKHDQRAGKKFRKGHVGKEESQRRKRTFVYLKKDHPGMSDKEIADTLGVSLTTIGTYNSLYAQGKMPGQTEKPSLQEAVNKAVEADIAQVEAPEYRVPTFEAPSLTIQPDYGTTVSALGLELMGKTPTPEPQPEKTESSEVREESANRMVMELKLAGVNAEAIRMILASAPLQPGKTYRLDFFIAEE